MLLILLVFLKLLARLERHVVTCGNWLPKHAQALSVLPPTKAVLPTPLCDLTPCPPIEQRPGLLGRARRGGAALQRGLPEGRAQLEVLRAALLCLTACGFSGSPHEAKAEGGGRGGSPRVPVRDGPVNPRKGGSGEKWSGGLAAQLEATSNKGHYYERSKDATNVAPGLATRSKDAAIVAKLLLYRLFSPARNQIYLNLGAKMDSQSIERRGCVPHNVL